MTGVIGARAVRTEQLNVDMQRTLVMAIQLANRCVGISRQLVIWISSDSMHVY